MFDSSGILYIVFMKKRLLWAHLMCLLRKLLENLRPWLNRRYTTAIDMWSFGCVAAELFLGLPLFPAQSQYDLLQRMIKILGWATCALFSSIKYASFSYCKCMKSWNIDVPVKVLLYNSPDTMDNFWRLWTFCYVSLPGH